MSVDYEAIRRYGVSDTTTTRTIVIRVTSPIVDRCFEAKMECSVLGTLSPSEIPFIQLT